MLYTRKGDNGTTKTFSCDQRLSKSSTIAEALGGLDEINSFLGIVKMHSDTPKSATVKVESMNMRLAEIIPAVRPAVQTKFLII